MKKIIVAEGSPTIKSVADSVLRQNGYDVVCTSDGLQAWEVISSEKPDLVLSGLGLSGISGLELCRMISKDTITGGVPTVLMIGPKDPVSDAEIIASGARGKLRKPFSPKELLDIVGKLTGIPSESPKPANNNEPPTDLTKFSAQVSSTQHLKEKSVGMKLDWLDLNDSAPSIRKVVSLDINSDEQPLVIEEDQYGLSREHSHGTAESGLKDKDDYDWFIGEMKRESENKAAGKLPPEIAESKTVPVETIQSAPSEIVQHPNAMHFDELHSSLDTGDSSGQSTLSKPQSPTVMEIDSQPSAPSRAFSEEELTLVVDRVVSKLATQIAAAIDRNQIVEAIKSALKT